MIGNIMSYSYDKAGYGNNVTSDEDIKRHKKEMEDLERKIYIRDKPSWQRTEEEKKLLREYYGL